MRVVSRPLGLRLSIGLSVAILGFLASVLAGELFQSLIGFSLGLVITAWLAVRGFRISLITDRHEIIIRNHLRTHRLSWEQISAVGIGITSSLTLQVSAVVFRERGADHVVAAQATAGEREALRVIRELSLLRPDLPIRFSE